MDTFWLKVAGLLVLIVAVIVGVLMILPANDGKPAQPDKTFQQMVEKDKTTINAEPNAADLTPTLKQAEAPAIQPKEAPAPKPVIFYFTKLDEVGRLDAEEIFATIPSFKSIGRLPMLGYHTMMQSCLQLMQRYPGSIYDYKARRALAQIPKQYWSRYRIKPQMVDLSQFTVQRQNTYPYNPQEDN